MTFAPFYANFMCCLRETKKIVVSNSALWVAGLMAEFNAAINHIAKSGWQVLILLGIYSCIQKFSGTL